MLLRTCCNSSTRWLTNGSSHTRSASTTMARLLINKNKNTTTSSSSSPSSSPLLPPTSSSFRTTTLAHLHNKKHPIRKQKQQHKQQHKQQQQEEEEHKHYFAWVPSKEETEASLGYTDVFPTFPGNPVDASITIEYYSRSIRIARNGIILTPELVTHSPRLYIRADTQHYHNKYFTVLMINPDVPTRRNPIIGEWINWLLVNLPNRDGEVTWENTTEDVVEYIGAAPMKGEGLNRFIFCVFAHDEPLRDVVPRIKATQIKERQQFSAKKFAEKYHLGLPIMMESFQAEWNEYVPLWYPHVFPSLKIPNLFGKDSDIYC